MTPDVRARISRQRFETWDRKLAELNATPAVMVSVGHGDHEGTLLISVPIGVPGGDAAVAGMLRAALRFFEEGGAA